MIRSSLLVWKELNHLKHSFYTIYTLVYKSLFPIFLKLLASPCSISASRYYITHRLLGKFQLLQVQIQAIIPTPTQAFQQDFWTKHTIKHEQVHICHHLLGTLPQYNSNINFRKKNKDVIPVLSTILLVDACLIYQSHKRTALQRITLESKTYSRDQTMLIVYNRRVQAHLNIYYLLARQ